MSKSIIFCADGTWNGPSEPDDTNPAAPATNVFKLFVNLDGTDSPDTLMLGQEQERVLTGPGGTELQHAKYLHGVGDSSNYLVRLIGGTVGAGLIVRIVRGYTFISRVYRPGDTIFIVGFSRGAYTARALAGLIADQGLLDGTKLDLADKDNAYRLGSAVWSAHFRKQQQANGNLAGRAEGLILELPGFFSSAPPVGELIPAPIEAVAVWDTVGSLGIPAFTLKLARVDLLQFTDTKLSPVVKHGFHAVAIDERRADFTPTLWDRDDRITQALFPGAHADVGGGYITSESGLSDCGLAWMTARLQGLGVRFAAQPTFKAKPDPKGSAHQPWTIAPWTVLPQAGRVFPPGLCFSQYAATRLNGGPVRADPGLTAIAWAPANLPGYYTGTALAEGIQIA
jgi:uncharacterized protein (DUF2235 family)